MFLTVILSINSTFRSYPFTWDETSQLPKTLAFFQEKRLNVLPPSFWVSMVDAWCDAGGVESKDLILRTSHSWLGVVKFVASDPTLHSIPSFSWPRRNMKNLFFFPGKSNMICSHILYTSGTRITNIINISCYHSSIFSHLVSLFLMISEAKLLLGWARPLWRGGPW